MVWEEPAFQLLVPPAQLSPILFVPDSILFLQSYPIPLPLHQILSASVDKWRVFPDYLSHSSHTQLHSVPKPVLVSIRKGWSRLLHALEQKGYITARDEPSAAGRPRRYYHLTDAGRKRLQEKETEWNAYTRAVGKVLKGGAYGG